VSPKTLFLKGVQGISPAGVWGVPKNIFFRATEGGAKEEKRFSR
jgi:hypothetical protein